ncbi:hypothetical protein ACNSPB_18385, partial [Yersinia enterocolitica]
MFNFSISLLPEMWLCKNRPHRTGWRREGFSAASLGEGRIIKTQISPGLSKTGKYKQLLDIL